MTSVTRLWAFLLIVLTTGLTTLAQFFLKTGTSALPTIFWNWALFTGVALYALGAGIMILSFKGGDVSTLYPVFASSYVWVALIAHFWFNEDVHLFRWIGIGVVIAGIILIGFGSRKHVGIEHAGAP